jgi:NADH:ubiquinone oxidoreductase subunit 6 (subunit J)
MIKLKWLKGKNLGLALIYLGIMTLFQVLFIMLAQFGMKVGSRPITILVPIGTILATFYCVLVLFESNTTMSEYRNRHQYKHRRKKHRGSKKVIQDFIKNMYIQPILYVIVVFSVLFFLTWLLMSAFINQTWIVFIINDNVAVIGLILFTSYFEKSTTQKIR